MATANVEPRPRRARAGGPAGNRPAFGKALRRLRRAGGLGVRELARRADVLASSISHYENGRQVPKPEALRQIAGALSVPPELLMWFAYTGPRTGGPRSDLLRRVDRIMLRQLRLFERALAGAQGRRIKG